MLIDKDGWGNDGWCSAGFVAGFMNATGMTRSSSLTSESPEASWIEHVALNGLYCLQDVETADDGSTFLCQPGDRRLICNAGLKLCREL